MKIEHKPAFSCTSDHTLFVLGIQKGSRVVQRSSEGNVGTVRSGESLRSVHTLEACPLLRLFHRERDESVCPGKSGHQINLIMNCRLADVTDSPVEA